MGIYSVKGSVAFDARIDRDLQHIVDAVRSSPLSIHWRALVLLGGYGRGEGSPFIRHENGKQIEEPFNDYDLIVVTNDLSDAIRAELTSLETRLSNQLGLPVDLYPYLERKLPSCEFSLLNYELKYGHKVLDGDPQILDAMPAYPHNAIPLSEGSRLLLNRGKLLLDIRLRLAQPDPLSNEERTRFIKFIYKTALALGDCALLINRRYDISYTVKKERIAQVDLTPLCDHPEDLIRRYRDAIAFKEWTDLKRIEPFNLPVEANRITSLFIELFRRYEAARLGLPPACADEVYRHALPRCANEGCPLKNAARQLRFFRALPPGGPRWLLAHPRLRLYAALPLLLEPDSDPARIGQILGTPTSSFTDAANAFYRLREPFT